MTDTEEYTRRSKTDLGTERDRSIVVIGAGQAGLATGYFLQESGLEFTILADDERIGDPWRDRWDSLRLFTPAFYNRLPGRKFPAEDPDYLPEKNEVADYLEAYAEAFDLPVQLDTRVTRLFLGRCRCLLGEWLPKASAGRGGGGTGPLFRRPPVVGPAQFLPHRGRRAGRQAHLHSHKESISRQELNRSPLTRLTSSP